MRRTRSVRFEDVGDIGEGELTTAPLPAHVSANPNAGGVVAYQHATSASTLDAEVDARRIVSADHVDIIRRVWGDIVCADGVKVAAILRTRSVISEETSRVLQSAINIGRSLNELKLALLPEEFDRGMRSSREVFPGWSQGNMSKLMNIARFIDERHLPADSVPQSYTTLYEFTTLDDVHFQKAQELHLFRPDVQRSAVQQFKRIVAKTGGLAMINSNTSATKEITSIDTRLVELQREMRELRRRRAILVGSR